MGKFFLLCLPFLALNSLQTTLFTNGPLNTLGYPDFTILIVIFAGLSFPRTKALEVAFVAGFIRDLYRSGGMGPGMLIFLAVALLTTTMQEKIYQDNPITLGGSMFTLTFITQLSFSVADYHTLLLPLSAWGTIMGISVISGLISIPLTTPWQRAFPKKKKYY